MISINLEVSVKSATVPLSATVEKQNCGVNVCGASAGSAMISLGAGFASAREAFDQNQFARMNMDRDCIINYV
jgi:hypothetical protein